MTEESASSASAAALIPAEFHATWRSTRGFMVVVMALFVAAFAFMGFTIGQGGVLIFGLCAAALALLGIAIAKPLWDGAAMFRLGSEGLTVRGAKQTIAWSEVADLYIDHQQSGPHLLVQLVPESGKPARAYRFSLNMLQARLHPMLLQTAFNFFASQSGERALYAVQAHRQQAAVHEAFDIKLAQLTPRVWAMHTVMLICAAVWVANVISGMSPMQPGGEDLYRWGANATSAVQAGQWWRLLTAMFLHGGIVHLALNMYALWEAGLMVTRFFGNRGFLVAYLGAGLVGNALSLYFSGQTGVSVGSSGAVFGVAGALLAAVLQHRGKFPMGRSKQMLTSLAIFIVYSLVYGLSRQGIDNAAHIGGLAAGFVVGWLLVEKIGEDATPARRNKAAAIASLACAVAVVLLAHFSPLAKRDMALYFSDVRRWNELQVELTQAVRQLKDDSLQMKEGKLDQAAMLNRLETVHAPALRRLESAFASLHLPKDEMIGRYADAQRRYAGAMAELMATDAQRSRLPTAELTEKTQRLAAEAKEASAAMDALNAQAAQKKQ
jgi:rhomboid protease GluP